MIRLAIYLLLYMIPAAILGYIILLIFPHISTGILMLLNCLVIVGGLLQYRVIRKRREAEDGVEMPEWLSSNKVLAFISIGTVIASVAISGSNKTALYIDNASEVPVTVKIASEGTFTIPSNNYKMITVVKGELQVEYNNKKRTFSLPDEGNWIFNIDTLNSYFKTSVTYSSEADLYKNGKNIPEEDEADIQLVNEEFFNSKVDYVFEVPETISIKKSRFSGKAEVSKKVLYRLNDKSFQDALGDYETDEETEEADSLPAATPAKTQTHKKK